MTLAAAALVAGIFFAAWPIMMNASGLSARASFFMYAAVSFGVAVVAMALPRAAWWELKGPALRIGLAAGVMNVIGVFAFMYVLSHTDRVQAPRYIASVFILNVMLAGLWAAYQARTFDLRLVAAIAAGALTVYLFSGRS
jgi:hypothetical protein